MAKSDMVIFNEFFQPAIIERFAQMLTAFNQGSGGAIVLANTGNIGDYLQESMWKALTGTRRVDRNAANNDVAAESISQLDNVSVKIAGGFGPILYEPGQLTWLRKPTGEAITMAAQYFAEALLADQLNTALLATVNALSVNADVVLDVSGTQAVTQATLNGSHSLFGDASQSLITQVMSGQAYHRLIGQALTNENTLFSEGTVTIVDILGKRSVITDAPILLPGAIAVGNDCVVSLSDGGIVVRDGGDLISNIETTNGKERIETTMQADYTFTLGMKGYSWDIANGGSSPSDAAIATGANWVRTATSRKHTAGVLAIGLADVVGAAVTPPAP